MNQHQMGNYLVDPKWAQQGPMDKPKWSGQNPKYLNLSPLLILLHMYIPPLPDPSACEHVGITRSLQPQVILSLCAVIKGGHLMINLTTVQILCIGTDRS